MTPRALLERLARGPASGTELAQEAGLTRAAIWKQVRGLRAAGVAIEVRPGCGYALVQPLDLLDAGNIRASLPSAVLAQLDTLEVAWSLDSTNARLLRRPAAADGVQVLLAESQRDGRGRRGRGWASPLAANLYLSLARRFDAGLARLPGLSLVAGIATTQALHALGFGQVRLKWPNDLVVAGTDGGLRKLGGLLVEGDGEVAGPARAVIGLGLNIAMPPAAAAAVDQPWCDLACLAGDVPVLTRNQVAASVLAHWLPTLARFDALGLAPFLPDYARLDALAGGEVHVHGAHDTRTGTVLGLAEDGALRVSIDGVERRVHAGEVSLRTTTGAA